MSKFLDFLNEKKEVVDDSSLVLGRHNNTRNDVDQKQLRMGIKIEMEHVPDSTPKVLAKEIAIRIALDHLAEIPDYYTRLIKMEKEAGIK